MSKLKVLIFVVFVIVVLIVIRGVFVWQDDKNRVDVISKFFGGQENEEWCNNHGGRWEFISTSLALEDNYNVCNLPTSDAGKECSDSSQCKSWCVAPEGFDWRGENNNNVVGECYGWERSSGLAEVEDGEVNVWME